MRIPRIATRALLLAVIGLLLTCAAASAATVTEFFDDITLGSSPREITTGPDGNLWFTEPDADQIARITPSGVVTEFSEGIDEGSEPLGITAGPDGNLWFTEYTAGQIGRIDPDTGVVTEFSVGITPGSSPRSIVAGPPGDNSLWYTDSNGRRIGRVNATTGAVTEIDVNSGVGGGPDEITVGPDGNLWFTELANGIGRVTPAATPVFTRFPGSFGQFAITTGPDDNLWTTDSFGPIRRFTTAPVVTGTFPLQPEISAQGITSGPDDNLWFADGAFDSIGRITPSGVVAIVTGAISVGSRPQDITTGPDGNLWFTQPGLDQIGRITPTIDAPTVTAADATAITQTTARLSGVAHVDSVFSAVRFEYGTTTAYGSLTELGFADSPAPEPFAAALANLKPSTTYHYRAIVSNGAGNAQSPDRVFTTAAAPLPVVPACSNGRDDDRDGFTDARDSSCHADGNPRVATSYRPLAASESPVDDPVLVCSSGGLALVSAELVSSRTRVRVRGIAERSQGKVVGVFVAGRRVTSARVRSDGTFQTTFRRARGSLALVRYQARLGTRRSRSLVAQRRLTGVRMSVSAGKVVLSGRTTGRRPRSVELLGRAGGCGALKRMATARVRSNGTFRLTVAAPTAVNIATYSVRIAAVGAGGVREVTAQRALKLR